jgi:5'-methylthioadenosine phosphorylase
MQQRIGIIGGSGLGQTLLARGQGKAVRLDTPFGPPSADPIELDYDGVPVIFLARHGLGHTFSPTDVPYRANIYALKSLGCRWILASGAVGSLREHIAPGDLVLADQIIDQTCRRPASFFAEAAGADAPAPADRRGGGGAAPVRSMWNSRNRSARNCVK